MNRYYLTRLWELTYFRCLSSTYLHLRHAFWHLRRTRDDRLQCGMSFIHFLVFQIFAHPARHVAQHFTFDHEVPHFPFIKIALHLRLGNTFLQTVGPVGPMKKAYCLTSYTTIHNNFLLPLKKTKFNKWTWRTWTSRADTSAVNFLFVLVQNAVITGFWIKKYKILNINDERWHWFRLRTKKRLQAWNDSTFLLSLIFFLETNFLGKISNLPKQ